MYHMIQLLKQFNMKRRIELSVEFFNDLSWWTNFAETFNAYADFFNPVDNSIELYTDACLQGMAAICENDFYQARVFHCDNADLYCLAASEHAYDVFVPVKHAANINVLELIAILIAIYRWENLLYNQQLIIYCDNLQVCYNLCKDKTKNALSNQCLRKIFWKCIEKNAYISPVYIPSKYNVDADYLSRVMLT